MKVSMDCRQGSVQSLAGGTIMDEYENPDYKKTYWHTCWPRR